MRANGGRLALASELGARGPAVYLRCSWESRGECWGAEAGSEWSFAAVKPGAWPRLVGSRRRRALVESLLLRPPAGGEERVAGWAESSGRDEARSSAAVSGEK